MNFSVPLLPYGDVAESAVTSNVVDVRDAYDLTFSVRTSAGTTSTVTYQVSNWTGRLGESDPPEATWSDWTSFAPSAVTVMQPILGVAYSRFLRTPSLASFIVEGRKQVR